MIPAFIFILLMILFYLSLYFGKHLSGRIQLITDIGKNIFTKKMDQYTNSKLFSPLRNAVEKTSIPESMGFIAPMIILKSIGFYFISLLLITPFIVLLQGFAMGSMFVYHEKQIGSTNELSRITFWQLFSHLIIASFGCAKGLDWLFNTNIIANANPQLFSNINVFIILSIITAIIASFIEARALMNSQQ